MGRTDEVKTQAALALADAGKARCTACSRVYPITEVLAVFWGGAPIYVICASCLPATPVVIKQTETGAWVGPLNKLQRAPDLMVARNMQDAVHGAGGQSALGEKHSMDFGPAES